MLKTLATAVGMVLLVSSFGLAGQAPAKPTEHPTVTQATRHQTNKNIRRAKTPHKHHKKHHAQARKR